MTGLARDRPVVHELGDPLKSAEICRSNLMRLLQRVFGLVLAIGIAVGGCARGPSEPVASAGSIDVDLGANGAVFAAVQEVVSERAQGSDSFIGESLREDGSIAISVHLVPASDLTHRQLIEEVLARLPREMRVDLSVATLSPLIDLTQDSEVQPSYIPS